MASWNFSNDAIVNTLGQEILPAVAPGQPKRTKLLVQNQDVGDPVNHQRTVRVKFEDDNDASTVSGLILPYLAVYEDEGENCHQGRVTCASMNGTNVQVLAQQGS